MVCVLLKDSARLLQLRVRPDKLACVARPDPPNIDIQDDELGVLVRRVFTNLIFLFHIFSYYITLSICISADLMDADPTSVLAKVQWGRSLKVQAASLISSSGVKNFEIEMRPKKRTMRVFFCKDCCLMLLPFNFCETTQNAAHFTLLKLIS